MSRYSSQRVFCFLLVVSLCGRWSLAEPVSYLRDIKPILSSKCYACHGALKQESSLRVDAAALLRQGGDSGPAIVPGNAADSELIQRVTASDVDLRMPPEQEGEPLSPAQIALLQAWIDEGAAAPADEEVPAEPRLHWAYQPPVQQPVPSVSDTLASGHPIDGFLGAKRVEFGLVPQPAADRATLLRRVYLDMIGLPPTLAEQNAFLDDSSPDAFDRIADRLLASPHYGERWGRHWMDVWRYTDWFGLGQEVRYSQKHIWRWRDWIVQSLNDDKGYDGMIQEMLAGDELAPTDPDTIRATGFLARNWYLFNRNFWLDDIIQHSSKAFLGITFNCVRCHEHKYDPISHEEYYRFRAFFEPHRVRLDQVGLEKDLKKDGLARVYDADLEAKTFLFIRGEEKDPDKDHPHEPAVPAVLGSVEGTIEPVQLPLASYYPGLAPENRQAVLAEAETAIQQARDALPDKQADVEAARKQLDSFVAQSVAASADNSDTSTPGDSSESESDATILTDDFSEPNAELWRTVGGEWEYVDGRLKQNQVDLPQCRIISTKLPPADFMATVRFTITGGDTRSVGMIFDFHEDGFSGIFMSPGGPKIALYHVDGSAESYPSKASKKLDVVERKEYELKFALRDKLLNVWVDSELQFVYQLQRDRRPGQFGITTYGAKVEFSHASITRVTPETELVVTDCVIESKPSQEAFEAALAKTQRSLAAAEKTVPVVEAELVSLQTRFAADLAKFNDESRPQDEQEELARKASKGERQAKLLRAEFNVDLAENAVSAAKESIKPGDEKTKKALTDAEKKLADAGKKLKSAKSAMDEPGSKYSHVGNVYPSTSTGRRLALARWIANRQNPLAARVAVNHAWARHFGEPLVASMFDFGLRTKQPIHHELLDWLAVEFMESGWSMKRLHRSMVTSQAYHMRSSIGEPGDPNLKTDPDNHYVWRMNTRRMEGEIVRDSLLHLTDELDCQLGGADLPVKDADEGRRRTIYYRYARDDRMKFVTMFDAPSVEECYRRRETIVPQQALAMANSRLVLSRSRQLSALINGDVGVEDTAESLQSFIQQAFRRVLGRSPTDQELTACQRAAKQLAQTKSAQEKATSSPPHLRAREHLVHVLVNHDHFIAIR